MNQVFSYIQSVVLLTIFLPAIAMADIDPLHKAVKEQNFALVKKLVDAGHDINVKGKAGFYPLLLAAGLNKKEIVVYLVENGADLNVRSKSGFGVLHRGAMSRNPEMLKYLVALGFDVNDRGKDYCTPLSYAVGSNALQNYGTLDNAKTLLRHGARKSINIKCNGYTPLMVASDNFKVTRFLLEHGADKSMVNRAGKTAYDMAEERGASPLILKLLKIEDVKSSPEKANRSVSATGSLEALTKSDGTLMWERKTPHNRIEKVTAQDAEAYCEDLVWAGYDDYRIPTLKEINTISLEKPVTDFVISGIPNYYIDPKQFPNVLPLRHWVKMSNGNLGYFSFAIKRSGEVCKSCKKNLVRCVRGGF